MVIVSRQVSAGRDLAAFPFVLAVLIGLDLRSCS
jgi:hypothetical protein